MSLFSDAISGFFSGDSSKARTSTNSPDRRDYLNYNNISSNPSDYAVVTGNATNPPPQNFIDATPGQTPGTVINGANSLTGFSSFAKEGLVDLGTGYNRVQPLLREVRTSPVSPFFNGIEILKNREFREPSPYALDLVLHGIKQKFTFVVEFLYNEPYSQIMKNIPHAFYVKTCQLPTVNIDYEEINMYNYRTKVPRSAKYDPINMSFYDDNLNNVTNFYNAYTQIISPILNRQNNYEYERDSMNFLEGIGAGEINAGKRGVARGLTHNYASSLGPLHNQTPSGKYTVIDRIRIYHVFSGGEMMNVYELYNPKIEQLQISELDMTISEAPELQIQLAYDAFHLWTGIVPGTDPTFNVAGASVNTTGARYPIDPKV